MAEEKKEVALKESNTPALLGFIFSLTGCLAFPGLILSIIGLATAKNYKNSRKGLAIAGVIISGVLFLVSLLLYFCGILTLSEFQKDPASSYNSTPTVDKKTDDTVKPSTNNKKSNYTLGDTFEFDGFEITLDKNYSFVTLDNEFSELNGSTVIKLGATIKNVSGETGSLNQFYMSEFGSKGTELDGVDYYFDESVDAAGDLRDGASYYKYFYILYDGNGKYGIDFDNYSKKITVEFDVNR